MPIANRMMPMLLLVASPVLATGPVEVVRTGDHAMACPALAAEINRLAADDGADAPAPPRKAHGFLHVLGSAAGYLPGVALVKSATLVTAAAAAQNIAQSQAKPASDPAPAAGTAATGQRRQRLNAIFEEKHC